MDWGFQMILNICLFPFKVMIWFIRLIINLVFNRNK